MGANNLKVQSVIESAILSVIDKLKSDDGINSINDLNIQLDRENGELLFYDDNESLIDKTIIFDWVENKRPAEVFTKHATSLIKAALASLTAKEVFEDPIIAKPFSVNLTDDEFTVVDELLFIDDELLRIDDPLLKDLDSELDDFLNNLLSDIK